MPRSVSRMPCVVPEIVPQTVQVMSTTWSLTNRACRNLISRSLSNKRSAVSFFRFCVIVIILMDKKLSIRSAAKGGDLPRKTMW